MTQYRVAILDTVLTYGGAGVFGIVGMSTTGQGLDELCGSTRCAGLAFQAFRKRGNNGGHGLQYLFLTQSKTGADFIYVFLGYEQLSQIHVDIHGFCGIARMTAGQGLINLVIALVPAKFRNELQLSLIFSLTLPFFALVGLGYMANRLNWLPEGGVRAINVFVFNFAVPALIISALARQNFDVLINIRYLAGWALAALVVYGLGAVIMLVAFKGDRQEAALMGQAASVGNLGFLALPLLIVAVGEQAAPAVASALIVDLVLIIPFSIAVLESSNNGGKSAAEAFFNALKGAVANPFFLAIALGVFLSATGIGLPGPSERFFTFLAGAAGPTALFSLGASLAGRSVAGDWGPIALMNGLKLFAHPLAAWLAFSLFAVEGLSYKIGIVLAAMPIAGNVFVIAEAYGVMVRRLSAGILISTILAVVTVALALQWVGLA